MAEAEVGCRFSCAQIWICPFSVLDVVVLVTWFANVLMLSVNIARMLRSVMQNDQRRKRKKRNGCCSC